jgi:hypothetical protein
VLISTHAVSPVSTLGGGAAIVTAGIALDAGAAVSQNAVPAVSNSSIIIVSVFFTALLLNTIIVKFKRCSKTAVFIVHRKLCARIPARRLFCIMPCGSSSYACQKYKVAKEPNYIFVYQFKYVYIYVVFSR